MTTDNRQQTTDNRRKLLWFFVWCCALFSLSSCFKEKLLSPPNSAGIGQTQIIEMGPLYSNQYFFSLKTNSVISQNSRLAYDLMFDCDNAKFHVWLNSAKFMSVLNTGKTDLQSVTIVDTAGKDFHFELGEYNVDSNSFGQWWDTLSINPSSKQQVYIVNLGKDDDGLPLGFVKMRLNNFSSGNYSISFADISSSDSTTVLVSKDDTYNYRYFSFGSQNLVSIEPPKTNWDFCFTRYTVIFYDPAYLPYEVTGVLHNPWKVQAYLDSTVNFDSVTVANVEMNRMLSRRDAIGYEWKRLESTTGSGTYSIKFNYTYFIKADDAEYYKLRFFQFDNSNPSNGYATGSHGFPGFEFVRL